MSTEPAPRRPADRGAGPTPTAAPRTGQDGARGRGRRTRGRRPAPDAEEGPAPRPRPPPDEPKSRRARRRDREAADAGGDRRRRGRRRPGRCPRPRPSWPPSGSCRSGSSSGRPSRQEPIDGRGQAERDGGRPAGRGAGRGERRASPCHRLPPSRHPAPRQVASGRAPVAPRRPDRPARRAPSPARRPSTPCAAVLSRGRRARRARRPGRRGARRGRGRALREDPWQLLRVAGVRPEQADGFARALLGAECGPDDERRGRALTVWLLEQAAVAGHTALDAPALTRGARPVRRARPGRGRAERRRGGRRPGLPGRRGRAGRRARRAPERTRRPQPEDARRTGTKPSGRSGSCRPRAVRAGRGEPRRRPGPAGELPPDRRTRSAADWETAAASARRFRRGADPRGRRARPGAAHGRRGGPRRAGRAARPRRAPRPARAGPPRTRADGGARRLRAERTGSRTRRTPPAAASRRCTATVTGCCPAPRGPDRDADGALAVDLLVVLDAPQLDVETAAMLVESLPDGARLVLSGDPGVLWSAGPGRVFADLLAARVCPQVASRTPDPGPIGELVSGIGVGRAEPGRGPRQGGRDRPGARRGRGGAPHGAAGRRLGAAGDRRCPPSRPR